MGVKRKTIFDEPIWLDEIAFERFCRATLSHQEYLKNTAVVYNLLKTYPKKTRAEDYTVVDVEDWAARRALCVKKATADAEVNVIRYFFNWLTSHTDFRGPNPAVRRGPNAPSRPEHSLTLEQCQLFLERAQGPDSEIVTRILRLDSPDTIAQSLGISSSWLRKRFRRLRIAAGCQLSLKELRAEVARLYMNLGREQVCPQTSTPPLQAAPQPLPPASPSSAAL